MKKINFKQAYLILAAIFILSAPFLPSCGNGDKGREIFSPESGAYGIMLKPEEWDVISLSANQYPDELGILNVSSGTLLTIECYKKFNLSDLGISNVDGLIEFYKTFESTKTLYENGDGKKIGDLTEVEKKCIKNSIVKAGKRQKIYTKTETGDEGAVAEIIYLETENHFLTILYTNLEEKFEQSQKIVNEVISHIKTEK